MRTPISTIAALAIAALSSTAAHAAPGVGEKVYGATVKADVAEIEARYGRIDGGTDDGADALVLEAAYGFSPRFYGAVLVELEKQPGLDREVEAIGFEGIYTLGRVAGLDAAIYGEYEIGLEGPDKVETKLLLQKKAGAFDARLNLIAEKHLTGGEPVEFGYAASVDAAVLGEIRLGAAAFGELGSTRDFLPRKEHFIGPVAKAEIAHLGNGELEIEAGYLFALGEAKDNSDGQWRLLVEYEFTF
ncbi:hypothetical protein FSZ31_08790 [Sphingorhabdus soli]|uniref:Uncharacterized protein n=1 Tax=Flavisphingopyxis soli TaxID=2601267 RepID=A0A5C6UB04_9SPHN|nr:hypothetical protein [Sphingorhabdus soli]TXC69025.1 hypothetical protein FSZ31_08790 [Sphingorhabdus soli]